MSAAEPWSKWFWTDYEADPGLRMSSLAAQGLWMRMLCLMAKATPKGDLRVGDEPCTAADLAVYVGQPEETVVSLLEELKRRGVYSVTRTGVIYNRRLRKDAIISRKRSEAGSLGAAATNRKNTENSGLPRQKSGKGSGKGPTPEARSQKPDTPLPPKGGGSVGCPDGVDPPVWRDFLALRRAKNAPVTPTALARIVAQAEQAGWTLNDALAECVTRGWQGFKAEWVARREPERGQAGSSSVDFLDHLTAERRRREEWQRQREAGAGQ